MQNRYGAVEHGEYGRNWRDFMGDKMVTLSVDGEERQYPYGTSFLAVAQEYQERYADDIVLVVHNNRIRELN